MTYPPRLVVADSLGQIIDLPQYGAVGRSGSHFLTLDPKYLVPLPSHSSMFFLPERIPVGIPMGEITPTPIPSLQAVAAFLPPGYSVLYLSAYERLSRSPRLPLYAYSAVCWHDGKLKVPAVLIDRGRKHDPRLFQEAVLKRLVIQRTIKHPRNRLLAHLGFRCALQYRCPNARNLFLDRWEAPIPISEGCNASCLGCISKQTTHRVPAPQERIDFSPSVEEILEIAVPHLSRASGAMISFGQGCEGEPLLKASLLEEVIIAIRKRVKRGILHLNTNGSMPDKVERLARVGLNSMRVSMNSAREEFYKAYFRPRTHCLSDVLKTLHLGSRLNVFTSINLLTFPGVTDQREELDAISKVIKDARPNMIQWRNLNIDPDWYVEQLPLDPEAPVLGIVGLMKKLRMRFPWLRFGYYNPYDTNKKCS